MNREELKCPVVDEYYGECEWERHPNTYYYKSEADSVMDAMEARIKELEAEVIGYKASLERANFKALEKDARISENNVRIKELEHSQNFLLRKVKEYRNRSKELEAENARIKEQVDSAKNLIDAANEHLESYKNKLAARTTPKAVSDTIVELREENARLKAQVPKWISVNDRLPNEKEQNELLWVAYVRTDNTIKYMYEASFDYETKQFYTENDWGDKTFILPSIWMVVPPPPTTEEFSATDKENG